MNDYNQQPTAEQGGPQSEPSKWKMPPIAWVAIIGTVLGLSCMWIDLMAGSHTNTLVQDTFATATAAAQATPTGSIPEQLQTALPDLSDWVVTENDGDVTVSAQVTDSISTDTILKARNIVIREEQHIWQTNVSDIRLVTISMASNPDGNAQDIVKCTVTQDTANALNWNSTPTQVWSQFDKTWEVDQGTEEY